MSGRRRLALAAGAAVAGAAAVRPVLDAAVARVEARMNPVGPGAASPRVGARRRRSTPRCGSRTSTRTRCCGAGTCSSAATRGRVDVPRLIEGNVALQVLAMAVKTPRGLNIERNEDSSDQVLPLALAKRWPPATWGRMLPRVEHLAAQAHALEARSARRVPARDRRRRTSPRTSRRARRAAA